MIIACPECSGPFELPAEHISELVQIECPHCAFRMILDFGAANDPSLVEEGMRMASGFRSASDYRTWSGTSTPAAAPEPARHLEPVTAEPTVEAPTRTPTRPQPAATAAAVLEAPARRASSPAPMMTPPGRPEPGLAAAVVAKPTHPDVAAVQRAAARTGGTVVGPAPVPPPAAAETESPAPAAEAGVMVDDLGYDDESETIVRSPEAAAALVRSVSTTPPSTPTSQPARPQVAPAVAEAPADPDETDIDVDDDEPAEPTREREPERPAAKAAVERIPPHTPPAPKATSRSGDSEPVPAIAAEASGTDLDVYEERLHGSRFGTFMLVLLLLVAGGLVGASVALQGTPDPRPLLEDLYRQYLQR